jgi:hypothetical protein
MKEIVLHLLFFGVLVVVLIQIYGKALQMVRYLKKLFKNVVSIVPELFGTVVLILVLTLYNINLMIKFFLFSSAILFLVQAKGQYVKVVSSDGAVLPFCSVGYGYNKFLQTNKKGLVKLDNSIDSIDISYVGFKRYKLYDLRKLFLNNDTVLVVLKKSTSKQDAVTVVALTQEISLGVDKYNKSPRHGGFTFPEGGIILLMIENPKKYIKLQSFFIHLSKSSSKGISFRVRLFDCDSLGMPSNDLCDSSILVTKYKTGKWTEVDLNEYDIIVKQKYFFIGVELIGNESEHINTIESGKYFQVSVSRAMDECTEVRYYPFIGWKKSKNSYDSETKDKFWNPAFYIKAKTAK